MRGKSPDARTSAERAQTPGLCLLGVLDCLTYALLILFVSGGILSVVPRVFEAVLGLYLDSWLGEFGTSVLKRLDLPGLGRFTSYLDILIGLASYGIAPFRRALLLCSKRPHAAYSLVMVFTASSVMLAVCDLPPIRAAAMVVYHVSIVAAMPVLAAAADGRRIRGGSQGAVLGRGSVQFPFPVAEHESRVVVRLFAASCTAISCAVFLFAISCADVLRRSFSMGALLRESDYLLLRLAIVALIPLLCLRAMGLASVHGPRLSLGVRGGAGIVIRRVVFVAVALLAAVALRRVSPYGIAGLVPPLFILGIISMLGCLRGLRLVLGELEAWGLGFWIPAFLSLGGLLAAGLDAWRLAGTSLMWPLLALVLIVLCALVCVRLLQARLNRIFLASEALDREFESHGLTQRERDFVRGLLSGLRLNEIAELMGIAVSSAGTYGARACAKLNVPDTGELLSRLRAFRLDRPADALDCLFAGICASDADDVIPGLSSNVLSAALIWFAMGFALLGAALRGGCIELASRGLLARPNPLFREPHFAAVALVILGVFTILALMVIGARCLSRTSGLPMWHLFILVLAFLLLGSLAWRTVEQLGSFAGLGASLAPYCLAAIGGAILFAMGMRSAAMSGRLRALTSDSAENALIEYFGLTRTEAQVICMLVRGDTVAQIARKRVVSPKTVATHRKRAYAKIGVHSQSELNDALGKTFMSLR